nr:hypothetical protein [Odoribacter lunatus]
MGGTLSGIVPELRRCLPAYSLEELAEFAWAGKSGTVGYFTDVIIGLGEKVGDEKQEVLVYEGRAGEAGKGCDGGAEILGVQAEPAGVPLRIMVAVGVQVFDESVEQFDTGLPGLYLAVNGFVGDDEVGTFEYDAGVDVFRRELFKYGLFFHVLYSL